MVVDRLSKFGHIIPLKSYYNSQVVADTFIHNIVKLYGIPRSIVSDKDKVFISSFWQHLFKAQGTTLVMSSSYHPQSDGQTEALNKTLEMYFRCFVFENPKQWYSMLPWVQYWYNTSFHHSIGMSLLKALYAKDAPVVTRYKGHTADPPSVKDILQQRDALLHQLKCNLSKAQQYMKSKADKRRRDLDFAVGDLVLVKLQPYRQNTLVGRRSQKLSMRYFGPFEVIQHIGSVAYKLLLPETARIHPIFHISLLKKFIGQPSQQYLPLPLITNEYGPAVQPLRAMAFRKIMHNTTLVPQVLIQWNSLDDDDSTTWEDVADITSHFPNFNLEDKVTVHGGSIVTCNKSRAKWEKQAKLVMP